MILVTGGTGLVGAHLLRHLVENDSRKIRATYRSEPSLEMTRRIFAYTLDNVEEAMSKIEWVEADLFDDIDIREAMSGIEVIFHCAAMVSFQSSDADALLNGNPKMTELLVNAAVYEGVESFIHVSSVAALGKAENGGVTDENTEWKDSPNNSVYAKSKYASELQVWRGMEEGLNVGIVNPSIILGPGPWTTGSSKFFHTFHNGFKFYTEGVTGFVDVRDVVECLVQIEAQKAFGKRYLAVGENVVYKQLFDWITTAYKVKAPHISPPKWMMSLLWRAEWVRSKITGAAPLVTKETTHTSQSIRRFSHERAERELGIQFRSIESVVKEYCQLYEHDLAAGRV